MKILDLISILQKYPLDSEVIATYESVLCRLDKDDIYTSLDGVVIIDAEGGAYKERFTKSYLRSDLGLEDL